MLLVFANHLSWRSVFGAKMRCDELIILASQCDVVSNLHVLQGPGSTSIAARQSAVSCSSV